MKSKRNCPIQKLSRFQTDCLISLHLIQIIFQKMRTISTPCKDELLAQPVENKGTTKGEIMNENNHSPKDVFHMKEDNGKTFWTKIGSAFVNRDGSINAYLDALPRDGKIQIRDRRSKDKNGETYKKVREST